MTKTILNKEETQEAFDEAVGIAIDGAESIADLGQLFDAIREAATDDKGIQRLASIGMFLANEWQQTMAYRTEQFKVENNVE
tara:strand:- start:788 stop:1033 length:246 start_codon:yes stop_codon:yes gene_type:complete